MNTQVDEFTQFLNEFNDSFAQLGSNIHFDANSILTLSKIIDL